MAVGTSSTETKDLRLYFTCLCNFQTLMLGKIEGKGATEDEVVGWHHLLNGHEFEQAPGDMRDREALCGWGTKSWTQLSD